MLQQRVYVDEKCGKCKGKLKTNLQHETLSKTHHSCVQNLAVIEVRVRWITAKDSPYIQLIRTNVMYAKE
jgi:phage FluMu protein Com